MCASNNSDSFEFFFINFKMVIKGNLEPDTDNGPGGNLEPDTDNGLGGNLEPDNDNGPGGNLEPDTDPWPWR